MKFTRLLTGLALGCVLLPCAALAQAAQPAAQPGGPGTVTDNKAIGSWTVRCFSVTSASPCDMYEELQDTNTHQRVLGVSLAYVPKDDRHVVDIAVPLGVAIASGVVIKTNSFTSPKLAFRRCDQQGCYVEGVMPNDMVASIAKSGPDAQVIVVADDGKVYPIKLSLDGFAAAHDSMSALAREKAKDTPPAPATGAAPAKSAPAKRK